MSLSAWENHLAGGVSRGNVHRSRWREHGVTRLAVCSPGSRGDVTASSPRQRQLHATICTSVIENNPVPIVLNGCAVEPVSSDRVSPSSASVSELGAS